MEKITKNLIMTQSEFNIELLKNSELICRNSQYCKGKQVGVHGRMFGADLMEELDAVCAVFAAEVCDTPWVVTKSMCIDFISPVLPNQIYKTYVGIENIGTTSLTLKAEIRKHSVHTDKETLAIKCDAVFVRINEEGESIKISDTVREKFGYEKLKK
jgi:acyl-CoA thioesterase YciA